MKNKLLYIWTNLIEFVKRKMRMPEGKTRVITVGEMLDRYEHLLRPTVDASHTFDDWLSIARGTGDQSRINKAERATDAAVLKQKVITELARRGLPPNTPILDDLDDMLLAYMTPDQGRTAEESKKDRILDALLWVNKPEEEEPSEKTLKAMEEVESGDTVPIDPSKSLYGQLHPKKPSDSKEIPTDPNQ